MSVLAASFFASRSNSLLWGLLLLTLVSMPLAHAQVSDSTSFAPGSPPVTSIWDSQSAADTFASLGNQTVTESSTATNAYNVASSASAAASAAASSGNIILPLMTTSVGSNSEYTTTTQEYGFCTSLYRPDATAFYQGTNGSCPGNAPYYYRVTTIQKIQLNDFGGGG